jgi:hypothetical protein
MNILVSNSCEQALDRKRLFVWLNYELAFRDRQIHGGILAQAGFCGKGLGDP